MATHLFRDRTIVLGVTGSIAAFKAAALASQLYQAGADVHVAMTRAATRFVAPLTFEALTHNPVARHVLALGARSEIEHVSLAHRASLVIIAPATANTLARLAHGFADDAVSALVLDTRAPVLLAPAMETGMWENAATQANLAVLTARGMVVVPPVSGHLASGAAGAGRMAEPEQVLAAAGLLLARDGSLAGRRVVITAGGTREPVDPVRVITNRSSGRMGYALAEQALARGAQVALITTLRDAPAPYGAQLEIVDTTDELQSAVLARLPGADALIMAAAPADFKAADPASSKIKKDSSAALTLQLVPNPDILLQVARLRAECPADAPRVVVGFAAETDNLLANAREKLERKRLDLIVANPVPQAFGADTVQATLISARGDTVELDPLTKDELAAVILDRVETLLK
jgi:phosphopantothenoylcysteine decarboxylase/phosphopantothenate--cysteine ligase